MTYIQTGSRRKQFVEVLAIHGIDGSIEPKRITLASGKQYDIDTSKDPCMVGNKLESTIRQYAVTIHGHTTSLYERGGRWWVLIKENTTTEIPPLTRACESGSGNTVSS